MSSEHTSEFVKNLTGAVPPWALGSIGTLLTFALVLKLIGIDFAGPINGVTAAYTSAIERQAAGMAAFDEATTTMTALLEDQRKSVNDLERFVVRVMSDHEAIFEEIETKFDSLNTRIIILEDKAHEAGQ